MGITNENETERTKLEKYLEKQDRYDFVQEVKDLAVPQLEARLLGLAKAKEQIENFKKADEKLAEAVATAKELNAPYAEQLRMNGKLRRYIAILLDEQGELDAK